MANNTNDIFSLLRPAVPLTAWDKAGVWAEGGVLSRQAGRGDQGVRCAILVPWAEEPVAAATAASSNCPDSLLELELSVSASEETKTNRTGQDRWLTPAVGSGRINVVLHFCY